MRKLLTSLWVLLNLNLLSNPLVPPPVISEFFYNEGDWQMELYFSWDYHQYFDLQGFEDLRLATNAGTALFIEGLSFSYDSIMVIDQSMLTTTVVIDPVQDHIHIDFSDGSGGWTWQSEGIEYGPDPHLFTTTGPKPGQSICIQYFYKSGFFYWWEQIKQSPPTIGSDPFNVNTRVTFSGYVFDQNMQPVEGVKIAYCDDLLCTGITVPPYSCIETDEFGYFFNDALFSDWYFFEFTRGAVIYLYDTIFLEPDSSYYEEYVMNMVGTAEDHLGNEGEYRISIIPNPNRGEFMISVNSRNEHPPDAVLEFTSANGALICSQPVPYLEKGENRIQFNGLKGKKLTEGLYICTLTIGNKVKSRTKILIIYE
ncbi:MAG: T9SS type A sorting domain-containing protein [Bacteroidales bacterium]|jgi:hypothetical protein|nr:T9SS type A sorting domain-containing protein [Bacteroidales bacterium]